MKVVRFIFLGSHQSGKSTLVKSMLNTNERVTATIGLTYISKTMSCCDELVRASVYDTSGQPYYFEFLKTYVKKADVVVVVTHGTEPIKVVLKYVNIVPSNKMLVVVNNKIDTLNFKNARDYPIRRDFYFYQCSAIYDTQTREAFCSMVANFLNSDTYVPKIYTQRSFQSESYTNGCTTV